MKLFFLQNAIDRTEPGDQGHRRGGLRRVHLRGRDLRRPPRSNPHAGGSRSVDNWELGTLYILPVS